MSSMLARKVHITATPDGALVLPALNGKGKAWVQTSGAKVEYQTGEVSTVLATEKDKDHTYEDGTDFWGIAGILKVAPNTAFIIAITKREQVAVLNHAPVYVVSDIAIIPLASQADAKVALEKAKSAQSAKNEDADLLVDDDDDASVISVEDDPEDDSSPASEPARKKQDSSPGEDVMKKKGVYGRFAEKWFSKRGWAVESQRTLGLSDDAQVTPPKSPGAQTKQEKIDAEVAAGVSTEQTLPGKGKEEEESALPVDASSKVDTEGAAKKLAESVVDKAGDSTAIAHTLTPKLLHSTRMLLATSRNFFFSYDLDITRNWQEGDQLSPRSDLPLSKQVDPLFYWNRHLQKPFEEANLHYFALPLMCGFVKQTTFSAKASPPSSKPPSPSQESDEPPIYTEQAAEGTVESAEGENNPAAAPPQEQVEKDFTLTLITRRTVKRAGLRYLRRGIDDEGYVANYVETEQLLTTPGPEGKTYSYVQIRGSIPLYFQQSPYSLKPKPTLLHSEETNKLAFRKHVKNMREKYKDVYCVSLVEKHGNEAIVGEKYERFANEYNAEISQPNSGQIGFTWFDFHHACRGMKFENVSQLFDVLGEPLEQFGWTEVQGNHVGKMQRGVVRTNCMDCLDRTNVVQSACARRVLDMQLAQEGIDLGTSKTDWFNILWADNGDAVSKQYASTAALKGDYTRTRKRNYRGALTDFGLSMSRYFTNIISDYFTQAALDFLLGNVNENVFNEFESKMMSSDPSISMKKVRQNAIEISSKIVISDESEELIGGWTLFSPREDNTLNTHPFTENVLLLTDAAIYHCHFDYNTEKTTAFKRVDLRHILNIQYGTYITNVHTAYQKDEQKNVGFIIRYIPGSTDIQRVNTRTLSTAAPDSKSKDAKLLAFKALPSSSSVISRNVVGEEDTHEVLSEMQVVEGIVAEIQRACNRGAVHTEKDKATEPVDNEFVVHKDVISLSEAKKSVGLLEQWGYSLKKLVWA